MITASSTPKEEGFADRATAKSWHGANNHSVDSGKGYRWKLRHPSSRDDLKSHKTSNTTMGRLRRKGNIDTDFFIFSSYRIHELPMDELPIHELPSHELSMDKLPTHELSITVSRVTDS